MMGSMFYRILCTEFKLHQDFLLINNQRQEIKSATLKTLTFFLQSNGEIVSKDELLAFVWGNIIVSDSSIFKQVELVRKLLIKASLPKNVIETIYKKGYKLRYEAKEISPEEIRKTDKKTSIKLIKFSHYKILVAVFMLGITGFVIFLNYDKTNKVDFLSLDKRESLVLLMNNDWQVGLKKIQTMLHDDLKKLSKGDIAFLHGKQGRAHYHLLQYQLSLTAYEKALKLFDQLEDDRHSGKTHLNMAATLRHLPQIDHHLEKQLVHIKAALSLLKKSNSPILVIDAQMGLAYFYLDNDNIDKAIALFEKTVIDAQNINDTIGAMIANNNLASTYLINNDYHKAIELGHLSLTMALEIGVGRYIASSYSLLSDLYQHQYRSSQAMEMIEHALKNQLANNEFSHLGPKLFALNYILVQTYQYKRADEMLNLTERFVKNQDSTLSLGTIALYKGMNSARKSNWKEAENLLSTALSISQQSNFKYKQSLNKAYLSLALFFNNNSLKAIEKAKEVLNDQASDKQSKAIAALALAYTYSSLEKPELSNKWLLHFEKNQNPKWLFEYKLYLQLKLEEQQSEHSILTHQTLNEIAKIEQQMLKLSKSVELDKALYNGLKQRLMKL